MDGKSGEKCCYPKRKRLGWLPNPLIFIGGDDETRTRDLRRDRPPINSYLTLSSPQMLLDDINIISKVFAGSVIRKGFGK